MSGKRPSDACLDFESRDPGVLPEQPLLKRRKRFFGDVLSEAMMDIKEESPEDSQISGFEPGSGQRLSADSGFQRGNPEREVDEESNKTADTEGNQKVPIVFPANFTVPKCFMCGIKANEVSPLRADNGALVSWRSYKKYRVGLAYRRKPKGEKCRICVNVYALSGFSAKHGAIEDYKKNVHAKGNKDEHAIFLQKRKQWLKDHNDKSAANVNGEQSLTRTGKKTLKRRLEVAKVASVKIKGRQRRFVETANWDEKEDGVFDKTKEVEDFIHGKFRKGCWVFVGRKGVWEGEDEEGTEVRDTTIEGEGSSSLEHGSMDNKRARIEEARLQECDKREAKGVEVKPMQINALLSLAGFAAPLALTDAGEDEETITEEIVIGSDEESASSDNDHGDDDDEKLRLTNYFQKSSSSASVQHAKAKGKGCGG